MGVSSEGRSQCTKRRLLGGLGRAGRAGSSPPRSLEGCLGSDLSTCRHCERYEISIATSWHTSLWYRACGFVGRMASFLRGHLAGCPGCLAGHLAGRPGHLVGCPGSPGLPWSPIQVPTYCGLLQASQQVCPGHFIGQWSAMPLWRQAKMNPYDSGSYDSYQ